MSKHDATRTVSIFYIAPSYIGSEVAFNGNSCEVGRLCSKLLHPPDCYLVKLKTTLPAADSQVLLTFHLRSGSVASQKQLHSATLPFPKQDNHLFYFLPNDSGPLQHAATPLSQFAGFFSYVTSAEPSFETRLGMLTALAKCFTWSFRGAAFSAETVGSFYQFAKDTLAHGDVRGLPAVLMILGAFKKIYSDGFTFWDERTDPSIEKAELEVWMAVGQTLWTGSRSCLAELKAEEEVGREYAVRALACGFGWLVRGRCWGEMLDYLCQKLNDPPAFQDVLADYLGILESVRDNPASPRADTEIPEEVYTKLEGALKSLVQRRADLVLKLMHFAPSLPIFLERLIDFYKGRTDDAHLAKDIGEHMDSYVFNSTLPYSEILAVLQRFSSAAKMPVPLREAVFKNPVLISAIAKRFQPGAHIEERDLQTIKEIFDEQQKKGQILPLVPLSAERMERLLLPLVSCEKISFPVIINEIAVPMGAECVSRFLKERVRVRLGSLGREAVIGELNKELNGLNRVVMSSQLLEQYVHYALEMLKGEYKDYAQMMDLVLYFQYIRVAGMCDKCVEWVHQNVAVPELTGANFGPVRVAGTQFEKYRSNKPVGDLFRRICGHFDSECVKNYVPQTLVTQFVDELYLVLKLGEKHLTRNTRSAAAEFWDGIQNHAVTVGAVRDLAKAKDEVREKIAEIVLFLGEELLPAKPKKTDVLVAFEGAIKTLKAAEETRKMFRDLAVEMTLLSQCEKEAFERIVQAYCQNEGGKSLAEFAAVPAELGEVKESLWEYYGVRKMCCVAHFVEKAFAKAKEPGIKDFGRIFTPALEKAKKTLRTMLDGLETFRMAKFAKIFEKCRKEEPTRVFSELRQLLGLADKGPELRFLDAFQALKESQDLCAVATDMLALKDVVNLHDGDLYTTLEQYKKACDSQFEGKSVKNTIDLVRELQQGLHLALGDRQVEMTHMFAAMSKGIGLMRLLASFEDEKLDKLKRSVIDYDDSDIRRSTFDVLQSLRTFADLCANTSTRSEVLKLCSGLYLAKEWEPIREVLELGDTLSAKLAHLCKRTETTSVLRMQNIDAILLRSELHFTHEMAGWKLFLSFDRKDAKKTCEFDYFMLQELSERAFLYRTAQVQAVGRTGAIERKDSSDMVSLEKYDTYLELTKSVSGILDILEKLSEMSYLSLESSYTLLLEKGSLKVSVKPFLARYTELYSEWDRGLKEAYCNFPVLTYWQPSQFWIVEDFLRSPEKSPHRDAARDLFMYAGINIDSVPLRDTYGPLKSDAIERLYCLGETVQRFVALVPAVAPTIPSDVCAVVTRDLLLGIYSVQQELRCGFPGLNQLLFCSKEAKWESVLGFFYRCLASSNELHVVVCVERLPYGLQNKMVQLLDSMSPQILNTCLAFVSNQGDSVVLKHLQATGVLRVVTNVEYKCDRVRDDLEQIFRETHSSVKIIRSAMPGLGKSDHVGFEVRSQKRRLRCMTLYGELGFSEVGTRLERVLETWSPTKDALCFKVYRVNNPEMLDELLIQLLLYRCIQYESKVLYLPRDCPIYVEIANTYREQLRADIVLSKYFLNQVVGELTVMNYLDIGNASLKHVVNYLKLLESGALDRTAVEFDRLSEVTVDECDDLMKKYFFSDVELGKVTLLQVSIFIKFLSKMLQNFERSVFVPALLESSNVPPAIRAIINRGDSPGTAEGIRTQIVKRLVVSCRQLTRNSMQSASDIDESENFTEDEAGNRETEEDLEFIKKLRKKIVPFRDRKLMGLCFSEQGQLIPLSYEEDKEIIERVITVQRVVVRHAAPDKEFVYGRFLEDELFARGYEHLTHADFVEILKQVFVLQKLETLDYVLTMDNYYKMIYIYLRAISNIPVILMGDTGCGKTRMIKFLSEQILGATLKVFNIHAGVSRQEIVEYVLSVQREAETNPDKKFWLFLDEFNTNENIGLLTEIVCDRMMDGVSLARNIQFVAACNPYRLKSGNTLSDGSAGLSKDFIHQSQRRIMYRVYQLPKTIIEYVWEFGPLKKQDEKEYISAILGPADGYPLGLKEMMIRLIMESHEFFRKHDDSHIVSLRDLRRYKQLYHWFSADQSRDPESSAILALFFCYYYRISSEGNRSRYLGRVSSVWKGGYDATSLKSLVDTTAEFYTDNMILPENVVKNDSLRECMFVMIICIMTKIPLLIVGKPGCSKTLALQIMATNLKGPSSPVPFFRNFPEVVLFFYQGSLTCDSAEIEKVFERARTAEGETSCRVLPVVVIDEIGLCELSPRNPLKVLHKRLEIETLDIGFIGISNWRLDEAKMNRVLYLTRLPPVEDELAKTARAMYENFNPHMVEPQMHRIAIAYSEFQSQFDAGSMDVFGLRDYYAPTTIEHAAEMPEPEGEVRGDKDGDEAELRQDGRLRERPFSLGKVHRPSWFWRESS